ncbi:MAG: molybdenum cofactor biosysynthesis protein [Planctomycetes bacterium]|nr:molybdenum cofactor biosysynthesis protein [Planctomycetota bacterium]
MPLRNPESSKTAGPSIDRLFISAGHSFAGQSVGQPLSHPVVAVERVECVAGRGLRGDRYFDHKPDYKGQVTFVARETLEDLWGAFEVPQARRDLAATRRNVLTSGIDLSSLIGQEFVLGGVRFRGSEECKPCAWMDAAIAPGAERRMRGRGGLRARILSDGMLQVGPVEVIRCS